MRWNYKKDGYVKLEEIVQASRRYLKMTPSPRFIKDMTTKRRTEGEDSLSGDDILWEVLADHLQNGWEIVQPDEIGALTSAPIISNNLIRRLDTNKIIGGTHVYAYMNYAVRSPVREMLLDGNSYWDFSAMDFTPAQQATAVIYEFMLDEQGSEVAMGYATDLVKRLEDAGLHFAQECR